MGISSSGGGNGGGGTKVDINVRCLLPKHYCAIYCDKANCGPVSGGGVASRSAGFEAVVGA